MCACHDKPTKNTYFEMCACGHKKGNGLKIRVSSLGCDAPWPLGHHSARRRKGLPPTGGTFEHLPSKQTVIGSSLPLATNPQAITVPILPKQTYEVQGSAGCVR